MSFYLLLSIITLQQQFKQRNSINVMRTINVIERNNENNDAYNAYKQVLIVKYHT